MKIQYEHEGEVFEIEFPDHVGEATRSQYLDFVKPVEEWAAADVRRATAEAAEIAGEQEEEKADGEQSDDVQLSTPFRYFCTLANLNGGTAEMAEVALKSLSIFFKGNLSNLPFTNEADNVVSMFEHGFDFFKGDLTICRLLVFQLRRFQNFVAVLPKVDADFSVEYMGETYYLEPESARTLAQAATGIKRVKYPVKTIIEISEWERVFTMKMDKGDKDGAIQFHLDMVTMALLLRKKGEQLPINQSEREAWIDQRAAHFKALPLSTFFQVRFFLTAIFRDFARMAVLKRISEVAQNSQPSTLRGKWAAERKQKSTAKMLEESLGTQSDVRAN